jgi:SSS family transporter
MLLQNLDWLIVILTLAITIAIGWWASKTASKSSAEYFLSGRNMPWWLLGISMVATTFSADTPNLVTDIVRKNGVAGNWVWWAFLLTGMLTVFVYARLWRRAGVFTDLEFYELRYSGRPASFLRGFRAIYLGVLFNVMIMATVFLAGIKIGGVLLGAEPWLVVMVCSIVTVVYTSSGGLKAVIMTDLFQFALAMVGTIWAAIYVLGLPEVGGLQPLLDHVAVADKTAFIPDFSDRKMLISLFIIPLAVQWWSVWYPGAEPGGGGYIAQRMLSAKDEDNATWATLLFNFAHYAVRPWPWILIALASLIVFPDLESLATAFPNVDSGLINDDLAYPAMLTLLPAGLLGLVIASLISALMSTISTHLNWGASYVVHDFYARFFNPEMEEEAKVEMGRWITIFLVVLASVIALLLSNALQAFNILLQIGAGTGLIFILRWFWWRINAWSEIAAMVSSFLIACVFEFTTLSALDTEYKLISGVLLTTMVWLATAFLTRPTDRETIIRFCDRIRPYPMGWKKYWTPREKGRSLGRDIGKMFMGVFGVYGVLFCTGFLLYGEWVSAGVAMAVVIVSVIGLRRG